MSPLRRGVGLLEIGLHLGGHPRTRCLEGRLDAGRRHHLVRPVVELLRVAVGRVTADVDDLGRRRVLARRLQPVDDHLALELADSEVVERDVVVRTGDRPVVGDDRDTLGLRLLRHLDPGLVQVDQDHDLTALGELLLGDARVLAGVVLRVLDVGLHTLFRERLLQLGTVTVLPAVRRLGVRQDDAGPLRRSGAGPAGLPARRGLLPVAAGHGQDQTRGEDRSEWGPVGQKCHLLSLFTLELLSESFRNPFEGIDLANSGIWPDACQRVTLRFFLTDN